MTKRAPSTPRTIQLAPVLDLKAAAPLQAEFLAARGTAIQVDASKVQRVGGLCLQVILSADKAWKAEGVSFQISEHSSDFQEGIALLGAASLTEQSF
jgi:chemotaxis protein CheX